MFRNLEDQDRYATLPVYHIQGGGMKRELLTILFPFLALFFFLFPDASTMEAMVTSPKKKSGNKSQWIRMLRWMDAW